MLMHLQLGRVVAPAARRCSAGTPASWRHCPCCGSCGCPDPPHMLLAALNVPGRCPAGKPACLPRRGDSSNGGRATRLWCSPQCLRPRCGCRPCPAPRRSPVSYQQRARLKARCHAPSSCARRRQLQWAAPPACSTRAHSHTRACHFRCLARARPWVAPCSGALTARSDCRHSSSMARLLRAQRQVGP
jgi:hypothetical protein